LKIAFFKNSKSFIIGINFLVLTLLYVKISSFVFTKGFASEILMFLGEKALLFFYSNSPQIENLIFVYPSIPYLFFLLLRNPFLSSAAAGGITVSIFLYYLWKNLYIKKKMPLAFFSCVMYLCASPLSIYMFSEDILSCQLVFFILLCLHFFYIYHKNQLTINLFLFGILTATIFFIHFEVSLILAIWALSVFIVSKRKLNANLISILVITFFPLFFFVLGWLYINWLHSNDFLQSIKYWQIATLNSKYDAMLLKNNFHFFYYFHRFSEIFLNNFLFIFPSAFLAILIVVVKKLRNFILLQILIFPFFLLCSDLLLEKFFIKSENHFFLLFIGTSIFVFIHHPHLTLYPIIKKLYLSLILLSFFLSLYVPLYTSSIGEKNFIRNLYGYSDFDNFSEEKKLLNKIQDNGKILLDDSILYPLVFLSNKPKRFILPHESEFDIALEKPEHFVEYIIISNCGKKDILSSHYNFNYTYDIKNFNLIEQYKNFLLYKISDDILVNHVFDG